MVAWQVAPSLETLRAQLNTHAPNRSKLSDGSIGDAAHASRSSDHNPWLVLRGVHWVSARDYTHDPADGADCQRLANSLVASRDPRIKYIIWDHHIWQGKWEPYHGQNPHDSHLHLSVVGNLAALDGAPWHLPMFSGNPVVLAAQPTVITASVKLNVTALQSWANKAFPQYAKLAVDGIYGAQTTAFVKEFQRRVKLAPDGKVGTQTLHAMRSFGFKG